MAELPRTIGPGIEIPPSLLQRLVNWNGRETLSTWFNAIPSKLEAWCDEWEIELEQRELPDTVSLVLFGESKKVGSVVIKIGPPNYETRAELAATREAAGPNMVRLIAADPDVSLIMLERLRPGTMLRDAPLDDESATRVAADRLREFWRTPSPETDLIPLSRWTRELQDFTPRDQPGFPNELVVKAREMLTEMLANPRSESLLHGDMHHHNILWRDNGGWTTIDPKGLIGERGFDTTAWMRNPWGFTSTPDFLPMANRRLDILAEALGEDRKRLTQWFVVFAALSLCWSLNVEQPEDAEGDIQFLKTAWQLLQD